ncbi:MAG: SPOR domain-containing protein [Magnetococcales bacterium]|nr:SPOR domain-containing protein [Magnetococcales bacterium]
MKISPNREQFMLVMIMSGLILFIVTALGVESMLSSRDREVRRERQVAAQERVESREAPTGNASAASGTAPQPAAPLATAPAGPLKVDPRVPEDVARMVNQTSPVKLREGGDPRAEPARNKPAPAIPGLAALTAPPGTPPPPPKPPVEETADKATPAEGSYHVQLGAFSTEEKAGTLIAKLAAVKLEGKPLPVAQQPIKVGNKVMYRVRLGPFSSSVRAKLAAGLVSKQVGVEGTVLGPGQ